MLNLASHWLPVRRFASSANRWYNLNSFLQHPEWISPTYLKMVLQQAEQEGYSVFVVRSLDVHAMQEGMVLSLLPECQADLIGLEMGDPTGRDGGAANSEFYRSFGSVKVLSCFGWIRFNLRISHKIKPALRIHVSANPIHRFSRKSTINSSRRLIRSR